MQTDALGSVSRYQCDQTAHTAIVTTPDGVAAVRRRHAHIQRCRRRSIIGSSGSVMAKTGAEMTVRPLNGDFGERRSVFLAC